MTLSKTRQSAIAALCIALSVVLPFAFHMIPNAGVIVSPMHIAVFMCALICDWPFALACAVLSPLLSSALTGMPNAADLGPMIAEYIVYAALSCILINRIHTKKRIADIYISLIIPMLLGRVAAGVLKALIFARGEITIGIWASTYFVAALPGIILQLVLIPIIYNTLIKAKLIPDKHSNEQN